MDHGKAKKLINKMDDRHRAAYENLVTILKNSILAFQEREFVDYTDHSFAHSDRVSEQLSRMIPVQFLGSMNSLEVFILLCSAYLHDIGMLWNKIKPDHKLPTSEVRDRHHELSRNYIREKWKILIPAFSPAVAERIGDVCYCHRKRVNIDGVFPDQSIPIAGDDVRIRLLAGLLRLADALDADPRRVPLLLLDLQGLDDEYSKREWQKHQLIEGIGYDPDKKHTIIVSSRRIDSEINRSLFLEKCKEIYTEFLSVRNILLQYDINYSSMNVKINELGPPPTTKEWNASALFPNPIPSWEALQSVANEASERIIREIRSSGKYDEDLYVSREDIEARFRDFINGDKTGFALVGASGVGKTNLFCHLTNEYRLENVVLFYNGAYLPTPDIETHIEKDLSGYCIKQTLDIALKNRYLIILVDGLNDSSDSGSLLRHINDIIGRIDNPQLKVAFTCRSEMWNILFDYERIALYRTKFFTPEGMLETSLPKFTKEELAIVYPLYKRRFELSTDLDDLSEETKEMLQDPLILRLVCETYKGRI